MGDHPRTPSEAIAAYRAEDVRGLHTQRESPCPVVMAWLCHLNTGGCSEGTTGTETVGDLRVP